MVGFLRQRGAETGTGSTPVPGYRRCFSSPRTRGRHAIRRGRAESPPGPGGRRSPAPPWNTLRPGCASSPRARTRSAGAGPASGSAGAGIRATVLLQQVGRSPVPSNCRPLGALPSETGGDMRPHLPTSPANFETAILKDTEWYGSLYDRIEGALRCVARRVDGSRPVLLLDDTDLDDISNKYEF